MSTIPAGTNYPAQAFLDASKIDVDTDVIRQVIDADGNGASSIGTFVGIDATNLAAASKLRTDQTAEPSSRFLVNVPVPNIIASTTEQGPFSLRYYAVSPVNCRLARASVSWNSITALNNHYIQATVSVMGYPCRVSGTSYGVPGSDGTAGSNAAGLQNIIQTLNDMKFVQFSNRPAVAAWQPIPIDIAFDFDGDTFQVTGLRIQLELNGEHAL